MTFDFFNTSLLAFGDKLTTAFTQLENLMAETNKHLDNLISNQAIWQLYNNRAYEVPVPTKPTNAARVRDCLEILKKAGTAIETEYKDGQLSVRWLLFNSSGWRFTVAQGSTTLKEGYAFISPSISNNSPYRSIKFVENESEMTSGDKKMFHFRIDEYNNVWLEDGSSDLVDYIPCDFSNYTSISDGGIVTNPYTAKDYECVCAVGAQGSSNVYLNGKRVLSLGDVAFRYIILYLKPEDVVKSDNYIFKVKYNKEA